MTRPIYTKWKIVHIWRDNNENWYHVLAKSGDDVLQWYAEDCVGLNIGQEFVTRWEWPEYKVST